MKIEVENLCKTFDPMDGKVLDNVTFSLAAGDTLAIIGPSGCGKTTLLYILAGLMHPSSGDVKINASDSTETTDKIAFILQNFGLFPWKTVKQNISLGLKIRNIPKYDRQQIALKLMEELDLEPLSSRYPFQLSGGQQQRIAIARALATDPEVLLMDEPFSSLDAITRERLQSILLDTWRRRKLTYVIVTHSVEEAVFLGKYILVLTNRPSRIKVLFANTGFDTPQFRLDDSYFDLIKQIREVMET